MKRWQIYLLSLIALAVIIGAGYFGFQGTIPFAQKDTPVPMEIPPTVAVTQGEVQQTIITPGQLVNYQTIDIPAGTTGLVEAVNVRPGEAVLAGDVLVQMGGQEQLQANLAAAEIATLEAQGTVDDIFANAALHQAEALQVISSAQQTLNTLAVGAPIQQSEALQAINEAREEVQMAEYHLNSFGSPASEATLTAAQSTVTLLARDLTQAENAYAPYRDKPDGNLNKAYYGATWAAAHQAYDAAVRNLNALTSSPSDLSQAQAEAELAAAQAQLAQAQATYDALIGGINPPELAVAEAELVLAQAAFNALEDGIDPTEFALAQANLEMTQLDLSLAEASLEALQIMAPFDGVILEVAVQVGEMVGQGSHVLQMADPQALEVLVSIVEEDYPLVVVGQPVELYFDAAPELEVAGQVERIVPKRIEGSLPQYQVYISIDEVPEMVVDGMTADAAIILAQHDDVLRLPRALVQANSDGTATVSVWMKDHTEERDLTVGLRGDMFVEILSGLKVNLWLSWVALAAANQLCCTCWAASMNPLPGAISWKDAAWGGYPATSVLRCAMNA
jgi:multidrug efflux pump subunit AcrA (membrane-fusion protein)